MFKQILEYQTLDAKLQSLERERDNNPAHLIVARAVFNAKDSQNQLLSLDETAKTAMSEYEKVKVDYENIIAELDRHSKEDISAINKDVLNEKLEQVNALSNKLALLEREISLQAENVNNITKMAEQLKKNIIINKQKYVENKEKSEECTRVFAPQIEQIQRKMQEMEKKIDPKILAKYKQLRQDKIFPVVVPLNGFSCGGCSMEIPSALISRLKDRGYLECEHCRRYIFTE